MIQIVGITEVRLPVICIRWAPRDWSKRSSWGPEAIDGFYLTSEGEMYRLQGNLVVYVTEMEHKQ